MSRGHFSVCTVPAGTSRAWSRCAGRWGAGSRGPRRRGPPEAEGNSEARAPAVGRRLSSGPSNFMILLLVPSFGQHMLLGSCLCSRAGRRGRKEGEAAEDGSPVTYSCRALSSRPLRKPLSPPGHSSLSRSPKARDSAPRGSSREGGGLPPPRDHGAVPGTLGCPSPPVQIRDAHALWNQ